MQGCYSAESVLHFPWHATQHPYQLPQMLLQLPLRLAVEQKQVTLLQQQLVSQLLLRNVSAVLLQPLDGSAF
jgi:hypothetical protein